MGNKFWAFSPGGCGLSAKTALASARELGFITGHGFGRAVDTTAKPGFCLRLAPHLLSIAGEQNHFVLGRHVHRSNRTVVLERYGQKPVHDPGSSPICFPRRLGASPGLKVRGSGLLSPRKHLLIIQGLPPWCLCFTKRRQACESHKNQGTTSVVSEIRWTTVAL